jgi:hypothetical protein
MLKRVLIALSILEVLLAACSGAKTAAPQLLVRESVQSNGGGQPAASPVENQPQIGSANSVYASNIPEVKHIVIKNASLSLAVDDPTKSMDNITKMAEEMGGFVVSASMQQVPLDNGSQVPQVSITIRVPAERLDEALSRIKTETTQPVIREDISSQDVTKEYTDLQSRLGNLQAAESQLKEIMASATKTEDVLNVYNQLTQVQEQIEVIKGQIKYYDDSAALSLISVELMANKAVQPLTIGGWQPAGVAKSALQALIVTLKFLVTALIYIVLLVAPVLVIVFLLPFLIIRSIVVYLRKRRKGKTTVVPPT